MLLRNFYITLVLASVCMQTQAAVINNNDTTTNCFLFSRACSAIENDDHRGLQELIDAGLNIMTRGQYGTTLLMMTACKRSVECVKILLETAQSTNVLNEMIVAKNDWGCDCLMMCYASPYERGKAYIIGRYIAEYHQMNKLTDEI